MTMDADTESVLKILENSCSDDDDDEDDDDEKATQNLQAPTSTRKRPRQEIADGDAENRRGAKITRKSAATQKWAQNMFAAFAEEVTGHQTRNCRLHSLCSGMGTEAMAMEALAPTHIKRTTYGNQHVLLEILLFL